MKRTDVSGVRLICEATVSEPLNFALVAYIGMMEGGAAQGKSQPRLSATLSASTPAPEQQLRAQFQHPTVLHFLHL